MSRLTKEDLEILCKPFSKDDTFVKVQSYSRDRTRACLVLYLCHSQVASRLDSVDPNWGFQVIETTRGDSYKGHDGKEYPGMYYIRGLVMVKGVARENIGEGEEPKAAYSDCLKRCAMLFGVGRYLYNEETVWVPYNESTDKFKSWDYSDYEKAIKKPVAKSHTPQPLVKVTTDMPVQADLSPSEALTDVHDRTTLMALVERKKFVPAFVTTEMTRLFGVDKVAKLTKPQFSKLMAHMEQAGSGS